MKGYFAICKFCNQNCITCPTSSSNKINDVQLIDELINQIGIASKRGMSEICISGGEPFSYPHIKQLLKYLLKTKLNVVILTNGTLIKDKEVINLLLKFKYRLRLVSAIHHHKKEIHDYVTNTKDSLNNVMNNLVYLNNLGIRTDIKIILNKQNYMDLKEIYCYLLYNFKRKYTLNICGIDLCGEARNHFDDLYISGIQIKESLEDLALFHISKKGKRPNLLFSEFPVCFMNKHSIMFLNTRKVTSNFAYSSFNTSLIFNSPYDCGTFSNKCKACILENCCPGFWSSLKDNFEKDLKPMEEIR